MSDNNKKQRNVEAGYGACTEWQGEEGWGEKGNAVQRAEHSV